MKAGRTIALLAGIAGIIVLVSAGIATAGGWKRFAQGTDVGPGAVAEAGDLVHHPRRLMARITTEPNHGSVGAKYGTKCVQGSSVSTRGRKFQGQAPLTQELRMRFKHPDACQVAVLASTKGYGRVTIQLFVKKP
jgi:hypothetical protein